MLMTKILFTKSYPNEWLASEFSHEFCIKSIDFISTETIDLELIKNKISHNSQNYIITSLRAAQHIQPLNLVGNFYCVGAKSAQIFLQNPQNKVQTFENGKDLISKIQKSEIRNQKFQYFCSNIRRDEIPDGLHNLGHYLIEIITYKTISQKVKIENDFDAYVFFSPSGVNSFAEQYAIPQKASIFAIGETTANAAKTYFGGKVLTPKNPDLKSLIRLIKKYFDAKK